jgi:hypothetical protein
MMRTITPRYRLYCLAHGYASMTEAKAAFGGSMHDFIIWIGRQWREWEKQNGRPVWCPKDDADHAAFDAWLERKVQDGSRT